MKSITLFIARRLYRLVILVLLACSVTLAAADGGGDPSRLHWAGWRGDHTGQLKTSAPVAWDEGRGILWRTVIPGEGHSSPVIAGNRVFLSTAVPSSAAAGQVWAGRLLLLATVVFISLGLRIAMWHGEEARVPQMLRAGGIAGGVVFAGALAVAGEHLLDFARCPIRAWLASAAFATTCLGVVALAPLSSRARLWLVGSGAVAAALILLGVPSKAHAFRGGATAPNVRVMVSAAAMPLAIAVALALTFAPARLRRWLTIVGTAAALATAAWFFEAAFTYRESTLPAVDSLGSKLSRTLTGVLLAATIAVLASWTLRIGSTAGRYTRVVATGLAAVAALAVLVDQLAAHSPYLAYHLGNPRLGSPYGALSLVFVIGALSADAAFACRTGRARPACSSRLVHHLALAGAVAAAMFFVRYTFVRTDPATARAIVAVDRQTGRIAWTVEELIGAADAVDRRNSLATPTPVTDGRIVCAYFGNAGAFCADDSGTLLWKRTDLQHDNFYGAASSPLLSDGLLILTGESPSGRGFVTALDVQTGASRWSRTYATAPSNAGHSRTPLVRTINGRATLLVWGSSMLRGFDVATGDELWRRQHRSKGDQVASLVADDAHAYLADAAGTVSVDIAALPGDGKDSWSQPLARANCSSPVRCQELLLTVTDRGIVSAVDHATGRMAWRHRLEGDVFASAFATEDAVYFTSSDGTTTVMRCGDTPQVVAVNSLREAVHASAAAAEGVLYIRTASALVAIGAN